jgi:demethylmenaquinone methyltransferase/2-methoxy-6-polyprenyl-1,4-benzoquinol methylase
MSQETTDFGFKQVLKEEKQALVGQVFSSVASKYDIMNDLMSFGIHRLWKKIAITNCSLRPGQQVLDLAGGTGDLTKMIAQKVTEQGLVLLTDINANMLAAGKRSLLNAGIVHPVCYLQSNAENLAIASNSLDCVIMSFGLRNVTDKARCLREIYRVLRPGGRVVILEFSTPTQPLVQKLYDLYSFKVIPHIGKLIANDAASYQYLAESIRQHPPQEKMLELLQIAGFSHASYQDLTFGICAIHKGFKI